MSYTSRLFTLVLSLGIALLGNSFSQAAILLTEPFNYSNGGIVANSGGNWTNLSGTGTLQQVSSNTLAGLVHGAGSREDITRIFNTPNITTGTVYASFSFTVNTAPTAGSDYFFALNGTLDSNFRGRVFLAAPATAGTGRFRLGLENDTATTSLFTPDFVNSSTYYALLSVNAATNLSSLWVGTDLQAFDNSFPTISDLVAPVTIAGVGRATFRQGGSITVANSMSFDNLVVATRFSEIVPEPSTFVLAGVVGCGLLLSYRRRRLLA
jgi:hypothetical protein